MRSSDEDGYVRLFRAHFRHVAQTVNLIVLDRARAEEIAQESFLQAWRKWPRIKTYERPEAWVRKVAIRLALRTTRRDRQRVRLEQLVPPTQTPGLVEGGVVDAVRALAPRQRAAVALFYLDDRPVAEIAQTLGVSESTVKQHLFRARAHLVKALGQDEEENDRVG